MHRSRLDIASAIVVLAVLAGVPFLLLFSVGWPLPASWTTRTIWSSRGLLDLATTTAWIAWGACCAPLCQRVIWRVRAGDISNSEGRVVDWLAARIAAAILAFAPASIASAPAMGFVSTQQLASAAFSIDHRHSTGTPEHDHDRRSLEGSLATANPEAKPRSKPSPVVEVALRSAWVSPAGPANQTSNQSENESNGQASRSLNFPTLGVWASSKQDATSASMPRVRYFNTQTENPPGVALVDLPVLLSDFATIGLCCLGASALGRRLRCRRNVCRQNSRLRGGAESHRGGSELAEFVHAHAPDIFGRSYACEVPQKK